MPDWIASGDDEFDDQMREKLGPWMQGNFSTSGFTAAENTALQDDITAWGYAYTAFKNLESQFHSATQDKDTKRAALEARARPVNNKLQANPAITNAMKEAAGITVPKETRTPAAVPSTTPHLHKTDTSTRAILRLFFSDSATPGTTAKPAGVKFCEVVAQIGGAAPASPDTLDTVALESRAPYRFDFDAADVGKTVYMALRWINTKGQKGPWSQIYTAVVPS
jgi:hypothetical protein